MTTRYTCTRCGGTGRLPHHANVLGGECFKCHGAGTQPSKPPTPSAMWAVFGHDRATGGCIRLYNMRAKTEQAAIDKARGTMVRASAEWKEAYTLDQARAIRFEDMADVTALDWGTATTASEAA